MSEHVVSALAAVILIGAACQWLAWRLQAPAILLLLLAGMAIGPLGGWLQPDALLGDMLFPLVSLSVAVILFEGALTLRFSEIVGLKKVVRRFATSGMLVTWAVAALAAHWLADLEVGIAILFGAIMVVTGPTVIAPMLRTVRPSANVANILRWEGIIIDPIGALLAVLVYEFLVAAAGGSLAAAPGAFIGALIGGASAGLAGGYALGEALRRGWLPDYLFNVATLAVVLCVFALANHFVDESGLLAVTLMGIYLGNRKGIPIEEILAFKETLSLLLITVLFILLAARIEFNQFVELGAGAVGVFLAIQFIARPLKVIYCTWGSSLNWRERALLSWIAPRGIVAAAVSALFALKLEQLGMAQSALLAPLTFAVIIGTVVLQSLTARPLARALKAAEPESNGFLILGANRLARTIALALVEQKIPVLLCDTLWDNVSLARMGNLKVYYGNPLSEHADAYLDLGGLGNLFAITQDDHWNELACTRYKTIFGERSVYAIRGDSHRHANSPHRANNKLVGRTIFSADDDYFDLTLRIQRGAEARRTNLTETFGMEQFVARHGDRATPLFAIDPKGRLEVFCAATPPQPGPGWTLTALIDPQ